MPRDLREKAIVLRRTKYGESDRILSILTPNGKLDIIAKGVRKEKSKLAGGIELFSVSEVTVHQGRPEQLGILTSSRMVKFYNNILSDLNKLELASDALRRVNRIADDVKDPELFSILEQVFFGLHHNMDLELVESWFLLNIANLSGESVNLFRDSTGLKLQASQKYTWDNLENALAPQVDGQISANHIKLMRLMVTSQLITIAKVNHLESLLPEIISIARAVADY